MSQSDTTTLRADLAAMERRATTAESALTELRGEVAVLRQFVEEVAAADPYADYTFCYDAQAALTATPKSAALGALVGAALVLTQSYDRWQRRDEGDLPAVWEHLLHRLEGLTAAADALAAMGKEGA